MFCIVTSWMVLYVYYYNIIQVNMTKIANQSSNIPVCHFVLDRITGFYQLECFPVVIDNFSSRGIYQLNKHISIFLFVSYPTYTSQIWTIPKSVMDKTRLLRLNVRHNHLIHDSWNNFIIQWFLIAIIIIV